MVFQLFSQIQIQWSTIVLAVKRPSFICYQLISGLQQQDPPQIEGFKNKTIACYLYLRWWATEREH